MFEELLGETGATIAQFGLSLIVVVALIFLVAWLVKRFGGSRFGGHHGDEVELQIVSTLAIDPKRKLVLVRHGKLEHLLLIGGGSDAVVERSMVGGIPLAARMQASKAQEKHEEEPYARPADRFRTSNRFSSALLRSKAGEETADRGSTTLSRPSEAPKSDDVTKAAAGVAAGTVAASASAKPPAPSPSPSPKPDTESKAAPSKPPSLEAPAAPVKDAVAPPADERAAIDRSLDEALSASLLDEPPKTVSPQVAPPVEPPQTKAAPSAPEQTPASAVDDLSLERELEAALELDAFERTPSEGDRPGTTIDLPPLDDLPDLPDLSTLTGNGETVTTTAEGTPLPEPVTPPSTTTSKPEKPDPLKLSSVREENQDRPPAGDVQAPEAKTETGDTATEKAPSAPDIPVALSGRDAPPIPVSIPSRGPAAGATTLAKADEEQTATPGEPDTDDNAVDISSMLQPSAGSKEETPAAAKKSDDLDDEMRRLLGEIAGEPEKT